MSHHFSKLFEKNREGELKTLQNKLPSPKICERCNTEDNIMNLVESNETIFEYTNNIYNKVDRLHYFSYRCIVCDYSEIIRDGNNEVNET